VGKVTKCLHASNGSEIWNFTTEHASCNGGPAIADGKVFISDWDGGHYYCLNETDGTQIWKFSVYGSGGSGLNGARTQGCAAYMDGKVYLTSFCYQNTVNGELVQGFVYCVDANTGKEIWNQTLEQNACGSVTCGDDGRVYVTTYNFYSNGDIYAINASTGDIIWQKEIWRTDSTPALAYGNVYTSGGYQIGKVFCHNATTGELVWETASGFGDWTLSVTVADGKVFGGTGIETGSMDFGFNSLFALDAYTGDLLWIQEGGGSSAAIYDGKVFTIGRQGQVFAYAGGNETVDLIAEMTPISQAYLEVPNDIHVTVRNEGSIYGNDVLVSLEVDGVEIDNRTITVLAGNWAEELTFTWTPTVAEVASVAVVVDPLDNISETNETNNVDSLAIVVMDGDSEIVPVSITPGHVYVNQPYEMTAIVGNTGYEISGSFDITMEEGSTLIANETISSLGPGDNAEFTFMWTPTSSGTVTLTMTVDDGGTISGDFFPINVEPETPIEVLQPADWSQFQLNWMRNGTVEDYTALEAIEKWSASDFNGTVDVTPIVAGDTVYVIASSGSLCAYDKYTGSMLWKKETEGSSIHSSTPAYGDGAVFVATQGGDLYAFDAITGAKKWDVHVTDECFETPITYYDHRIYIGDGLGDGVGTKYYHCYDDLGNKLWSYANNDSGGFIWNGASVVGDYVVYSVHEGKLVCLDRIAGTLADEVNLDSDLSSELSFARADPGLFRASAVYYDDHVYTTSERGQDGGYLWKVGFDPVSGSFSDDGWSVQQGFSTSTPALLNGRVYVGHGEHGETGAINCFNISSGTLLWSYATEGGIKSSPAVASYEGNTVVYFTEAAVNGSIHCIMDMDDHAEEVWDYNPVGDDEYILQGAAISDGLVYFGTDGGYLYCIGGDWNPWNDVTSTNGRYITISEVIDAYNCWRYTDPAPGTDELISISKVIDAYNCWRYTEPI
jgi:outer membrane protein assembly factor BamB